MSSITTATYLIVTLWKTLLRLGWGRRSEIIENLYCSKATATAARQKTSTRCALSSLSNSYSVGDIVEVGMGEIIENIRWS